MDRGAWRSTAHGAQRVRHDSTRMHSREMLEARNISWSFLHLEGNTQSQVEKEPSCKASAPP